MIITKVLAADVGNNNDYVDPSLETIQEIMMITTTEVTGAIGVIQVAQIILRDIEIIVLAVLL